MGTIDTEIVALSLQSVMPVSIGGSFFDVFVTLTPMMPSLGQIMIVHDTPDGGTFDSFFDVFFDVTFTEVGNPLNALTQQAHDTLRSSNSRWSHTPPPDYPSDPRYPSGRFFPGPVSEEGMLALHVAQPAQIPEPSSMVLLLSGVAGLVAFGRRRLAQTK